jgi:hypothetical protein
MRRCPWSECPHGADCVHAVEVDPLAELIEDAMTRVTPPAEKGQDDA